MGALRVYPTASSLQLATARAGLRGLVGLYPALKLNDHEFDILADEATEM